MKRTLTALPSLLALALAAASLACSSGGGISGVSKNLTGKKTTQQTSGNSGGGALSDSEAIQFLVDNCTSCHAPGKDLHSTWPMPAPDKLSLASLESLDSIADTYQALVNRYSNADASHPPSAMPPSSLSDDKQQQLQGLILWFQLNMPAVVKQAANTYGATTQFGSTMAVNLTYQCAQRTSARNYLFRLFNDALGRLPSESELIKYVPANEISQPVTDDRRATLALLVTSGDLKSEFYNYGLKMFAERIGGAGNIKPDPAFGISDAAATDLQDEFYHLLLKYADTKTWKDIMLLNKVMVTSNTSDFYDEPGNSCPKPPAGTWAECQLSAKRGNFFGTVAFLKSTPSSFLASNNNYKRGGEVWALLKGVRLMAQTDGPKGQQPDPMPDCMTTTDMRVVPATDPNAAPAPRGAISVPKSGAICQGCHLDKYLAAASFAFRPFDQDGLLIPTTAFDTADAKNPYASLVTMASTGVDIEDPSGSKSAVTPEVLKKLLGEADQQMPQCLKDAMHKKTVATVQTIADLTSFMVGDGSVLVAGLSRFIPSVTSNMATTNQEVIASVGRGFNNGGGMLLPMFKTFFQSETFSCVEGQ